MFSPSINSLSDVNQISYFGSHPFYCFTCKQRFQTEKNLQRHNNSRKHIKQFQASKRNRYHSESRISERSNELDILPNDVFETLITDVIDEVSEKAEFFNEIQLLDDNELDEVTVSAPPQPSPLSPCWPIKNHSMIYTPRPRTVRRIPATYPCLACFQSLDSQKNFDEHMLKAHFNDSGRFN